MNNSCRAPALSAIAFHPFCVGTVTRSTEVRAIPIDCRPAGVLSLLPGEFYDGSAFYHLDGGSTHIGR